MDDADSSDADRSNTYCKLNTFLYIGITSPLKGGQNINFIKERSD